MKKIKPMALAICQQENEDCNLTLGGDGENFLWMEYVRHAKAAIETIRKPLKEAFCLRCAQGWPVDKKGWHTGPNGGILLPDGWCDGERVDKIIDDALDEE